MADQPMALHGTGIAQLPAALPSMSDALRKWIEDRTAFPAGTLHEPHYNAVSPDKQIEELSAEYARYEQAGTSFNVLQGFVLAQAAALGETSLRRVVEDNGISLASASRNRDLYELFNQLGDLKLVAKAEALGPARIRELKPYFGIDGIRQLIEGRELGGMTYATAEKLPSREITLWVRQRKAEALRVRIARDPDVDKSAPSGIVIEPRTMIVARDELIGTLFRAAAELQSAIQAMELLDDDLPEPARSDVLHLAAFECNGIGALATKLRAACLRATDRDIKGSPGELETLPSKLLGGHAKFALDAVQLDVAKRASARHQKFGWKGRPPASLESVMTHARKADGQED